MDVSAWSMFFSFDVMGEVGFGKDFNNLNTGVEHSAIKGVHSHMTMLGIMSTVPWLLNILGSIPGAAAGYTEFFSFCAGQIREKHKVCHQVRMHPQVTYPTNYYIDMGRRENAPRHRIMAPQSRQRARCIRLSQRRRS
jgi:hypothetical protein